MAAARRHLRQRLTPSPTSALAAAATFAGGALLSVAAAMWQAHANRADAVARFQPLAHRAVEDIATRMRTYEYGLRGLRGGTVVAGVDELDGRGFLAYSRTRDPAREFPGARGFGVVRRVAAGDEAAFVAAARTGGRPGFAMKTLGPQSGEHFVILDVQPQVRGNVALGLDISSEPNRRGAAVAAMRSGVATLTGPITLFRSEGQSLRSFLLLLPIYRPGLPDTTPAEREAAAIGWTFAPLVIDDVLRGFDGSEGRLALSLRDLDAGDASVFYTAPGLAPSSEVEIGETVVLPIFGRRWSAEVRPTDEFARRLGQTRPASIAIAGVALAALLGALMYLLALILRRDGEVRAEQARRAAIVESSADAIVVESLDGAVSDWNRGAERLFGHRAEDAIGQQVSALLMPPGQRADDPGAGNAMRRSETAAPFDTLCLRSDGSLVAVSVSVAPINDASGRCIAFAKTLRDVSEARRAQRELAALNAGLEREVADRTALLDAALRDLRTIINAVPSMIGYWDDQLVNRFANRAFGDWFGTACEAFAGRGMRELMGDALYEENRPQWEAALRGEVQLFERSRRRDGVDPRHATIQYLPDTVNGRVVGFYVVAHDVTEAVRGRESLSAALQRAEASERFLREMSDRIPLRVGYLDTARRYQFVNEAHCQRFGRSREEIVGRTREEIVGMPTPPEVLMHIDAALAGQSRRYEFVEDLGRGRAVIEAHIIPDRREDGTVRGLYAVSSDISERKQAEHALSQTHALLRAVLDAASQASIIATRPDGIIMVFNTGAERMLGCRADEMIGTRNSLIFHDRDELRARAQQLSERLGETVPTAMALIHPAGLDEAHDCTYVRPDGRRVPIELVVTAMRDEAGELFGYLGIAHDVSRQRHYEQSLRTAKQRAEDANRAKSQFLANMSHEIRTPMNAVIGLSYLLERTPLDLDQTGILGKINLASKSLLSIINDILDLSKIEAGELTLEQVPFDLGALLRSLGGLMKVQADAKGIAFDVALDPRLPAVVRGDSTRLRQILMNLLSNAIKFTERGSVRLQVAPLPSAGGDARLRFSVRDSGIGIEPETMKTLFTPFVQADASTTRRFGGTGLGLSIVRQLAVLMAGQTGADSTPGRGSTFWVELELAPCDPALLRPVEAIVPPSGRGLGGVRVLITDDSAINLEVARRILELEGAEVTLATNGREAVELLADRPDGWDVVLMDVQMPVLDGHAATREIRNRLGLKALPVIALTAASLSSEKQLAMDAGMNEVISKPFDPPELARCIRRVVASRDGFVAGTIAPAVAEVRSVAPADLRPWPVIEGIDAADAQRTLGGDAAFFASLLSGMLAEYAGRDALAERSNDASLPARAMRMHKLKGSASTLGANAIAHLAAEAETALRAGDGDGAGLLEARLAVALGALRDQAAGVLGAELAARAAATAAIVPAAPLAQTLPRLLELLRAFDLSAAEHFAALSPQLKELLGSVVHTRLRDRMNRLEFGSVAESLEGVDI